MPENIGQIVGFLVIGLFLVTFATDIITQVIKKVTYDKIPTNIICAVIANILAVIACFIGVSMGVYELQWYYVVIAVILGIFAAFIGMNGFDKFMQTLKQYESILELKAAEAAKSAGDPIPEEKSEEESKENPVSE